jgi:hypothetical protein
MRQRSLQVFDTAQIAFVPAVANCVKEHSSMIELHRDHEPHVPETDGRRPALVRIARVDRLHLDDQPQDILHRLRTALCLEKIQPDIASAVAALGRVDDKFSDQIVLCPEIIVERGAVLGASLRDDVANRHAVYAAHGEQTHRG